MLVSVDTCSNTEDGFIDDKIGRLAERKNCGLDLVPETVSLHKSAGNMKPTKQSQIPEELRCHALEFVSRCRFSELASSLMATWRRMFFRRADPDLVRPMQKQLLAQSLLARQAGVEYVANIRSKQVF